MHARARILVVFLVLALFVYIGVTMDAAPAPAPVANEQDSTAPNDMEEDSIYATQLSAAIDFHVELALGESSSSGDEEDFNKLCIAILTRMRYEITDVNENVVDITITSPDYHELYDRFYNLTANEMHTQMLQAVLEGNYRERVTSLSVAMDESGLVEKEFVPPVTDAMYGGIHSQMDEIQAFLDEFHQANAAYAAFLEQNLILPYKDSNEADSPAYISCDVFRNFDIDGDDIPELFVAQANPNAREGHLWERESTAVTYVNLYAYQEGEVTFVASFRAGEYEGNNNRSEVHFINHKFIATYDCDEAGYLAVNYGTWGTGGLTWKSYTRRPLSLANAYAYASGDTPYFENGTSIPEEEFAYMFPFGGTLGGFISNMECIHFYPNTSYNRGVVFRNS